MTNLWIAPDILFNGMDVLHGVAVQILNGKVADVGQVPDRATRLTGTLTPGFVDLQVNGGGGVMINSTPTVEGLRTLTQAHRRLGTVALLPTVITDAPEVLDAVTDVIIAAKGMDGMMGVHIEGPHISLARRGTHAAEFIRPLDHRTLNCIKRLRHRGIKVMLTLAPEAATLAQVAGLAKIGVIVAIGHTNATAEDVNALIAAGATCGTHLFNAMSPMTGRAPGAVGALINSHCYTGIICDGHHLDDTMVALAIRARPLKDRIFLVSDAMATVGGPDTFDLYGKTISVVNDKLVNSEGNLAGAHVTQAQGVQRLLTRVGCDLQTALRMAITTPALCMARPDLATLIGRDIRDLVVLSDGLDYLGDLPSCL